MAKKKVYAVRKGKTTGLFYSWEACQEAVEGFPGAEFRGFSQEEDARQYLEPEQKRDRLAVYVDGSFDEALKKYSFGCIILLPDGREIRKSGNGDNPETLAIRNVAGEMLGAMYAVKWAIKNHYNAMELYYDYDGIEKWATGAWRTKNHLTQKYAEFMRVHQNYVDITFCKVRAHTGNRYNEEADKLAKAALIEGNGIPPITEEE